jgi:hypothetical protein
MKKRTTHITLIALAFVALQLFSACDPTAVSGNGNMQKDIRTLSEFSKISLDVSAEVVVRQGAEYKVVLEAESNILPLIKTDISGPTLEITSTENYEAHKKIRVVITMPDVRKISVQGSGDVEVTDVFSPSSIELEVAGSGNIIGNFISEKVSTDIAGSGDITLRGSADKLDIDVAGSGDINAKGLQAKEVNVDIAGSGNAEVFATEELSIDMAGSGSVLYHGNPARIKQDVTGSGHVEKR